MYSHVLTSTLLTHSNDFIAGDYADLLSITAGRTAGGRAVQSIIDDNGHYHRIDNDQIGLIAAGSKSGNKAAGSGYQGLDQSDVSTFRQTERPHAGLGAGCTAASTQQTAKAVETNTLDDGHNCQHAVGHNFDISSW